MTIKKLVLSTVAAAMVTTTVSAAGTTTATSQSVGTEGVTVASNLQHVDLNTSHVVSILGSISQGSVIYNFTGLGLSDRNVTNAAVMNNGLEVTSSCTKGSVTQLICDVNGTITSGDTLILTDATATGGITVDYNLTAGFSGATIATQITNSATTPIDTATAVTLLSTQTEWAAAKGNVFANTIDASDSFLSFQSEANATVTVTNTPADLGTNTLSAIWSVFPDSNLSGTNINVAMTGGQSQGKDNNYTAGTITAAGTYEIDYNPDGVIVLPEATFTTSITATIASKSVNLLASTAFGAFTTYGYNANIPGASYSAGTTDTIITLVNNQTAASADTVIVIKDATGTPCTLSSATATELTKPTANSSTKYKLSTMLGNSGCSTLTGTSYSIQVTLPTTPTSVFANAVVKRTDIAGAFKVLPVYNNGTKQ